MKKKIFSNYSVLRSMKTLISLFKKKKGRDPILFLYRFLFRYINATAPRLRREPHINPGIIVRFSVSPGSVVLVVLVAGSLEEEVSSTVPTVKTSLIVVLSPAPL